MATNGKGMSWPEMLVAKKSCLHGSRRKIHENIQKKRKTDGVEDPQQAYKDIKARLLKFCETAMERQLRVRKEWDSLTKTRHTTALQFEARWEELLTELEEVWTW